MRTVLLNVRTIAHTHHGNEPLTLQSSKSFTKQIYVVSIEFRKKVYVIYIMEVYVIFNSRRKVLE